MKNSNPLLLVAVISLLGAQGHANLFDKIRGTCARLLGSNLEKPVIEPAEPSYDPGGVNLRLARQLGFDVEPSIVKRIGDEIESFFRTATLDELARELGGRNVHTGALNDRSKHIEQLMADKTMSPNEKRAALVSEYRIDIRIALTDILQVIRYRHNLERDIGGWGNLWVGYHQYALSQSGNIERFSRAVSSFDGLIYAPGPDRDSLMVFSATHETDDPIKYISQANGGKPVEVSEIKIYQAARSERGKAWPLIFSAVVRTPKEGITPEGVVIATGTKSNITTDGTFLVEPFNVMRESVALSKNTDSSYSFFFLKGYKFASRIYSDLTLNYKDIRAVLETAIRDSGIPSNLITHRSLAGGEIKIVLNAQVAGPAIARFESELSLRVAELKDPVQARRSRVSPFAPAPM